MPSTTLREISLLQMLSESNHIVKCAGAGRPGVAAAGPLRLPCATPTTAKPSLLRIPCCCIRWPAELLAPAALTWPRRADHTLPASPRRLPQAAVRGAPGGEWQAVPVPGV